MYLKLFANDVDKTSRDIVYKMIIRLDGLLQYYKL